MALNKIAKRAARTCHLRSPCKQEADRRYFKRLFEREWESFLITRDPITGKFAGRPSSPTR